MSMGWGPDCVLWVLMPVEWFGKLSNLFSLLRHHFDSISMLEYF